MGGNPPAAPSPVAGQGLSLQSGAAARPGQRGHRVRRWLRWTKSGLGERGERLAWPDRWLLRLVLGGFWLPDGRCGPSFPAFVSHDVDAAAYGAEPQEV